jgi:hypothetical protein
MFYAGAGFFPWPSLCSRAAELGSTALLPVPSNIVRTLGRTLPLHEKAQGKLSHWTTLGATTKLLYKLIQTRFNRFQDFWTLANKHVTLSLCTKSRHDKSTSITSDLRSSNSQNLVLKGTSCDFWVSCLAHKKSIL